MPVLVSSDLHFTDKPQDAYRWGLFPFLIEQVKIHNVDKILLLGDTTDAKDKHSSKLVNQIVGNLINLSKVVDELIILRGNHDYIDPTLPYFGFLSNINRIKFVVKPYEFTIANKLCLGIPNMSSFSEIKLDNKYEYVFCHQTFNGALVENGTRMEGVPMAILDGWDGRVISGDVHVPQLLLGGKITYVGAPYHIHFGDKFLPRILLIDDNFKMSNLFYRTIRRHTITLSTPDELNKLTLTKHDQIKVLLALEDVVHWEKYKEEIKEYCKNHELNLQRIEFIKRDSSISLEAQKAKLKILTPREIFTKYCEAMEVGAETAQFGLGILEGQTNDSNATVPDKSD